MPAKIKHDRVRNEKSKVFYFRFLYGQTASMIVVYMHILEVTWECQTMSPSLIFIYSGLQKGWHSRASDK